jgi:hypothetical protein
LAAFAGVLLGLCWPAIGGLAVGQVAPAASQPPAAVAQPPQAPARSVVYSIHRADAIHSYQADPEEVHGMVDRLVMAVTGQESAAAGWRSLVSPKDVVGIKISATGRTFGATHRAVVERIAEGLMEAGVPRENIVVWDRDADDLRAAGYLEHDGKTSAFICPVEGIEPRWGYDPKAIYSAPYLGKLIWGDLLFKGSPVPADQTLPHTGEEPVNPLGRQPAPAQSPADNAPRLRMAALAPEQNISSVSHYCLLMRRLTKIVNVPVFCDNGAAGLSGALYNVTIPNVDNWRRLVGPPHFGVNAIPEMFADPNVGGRVVLNITDGLIAQIAGGPDFQPLYARHLATLYASKDAVAVDAVVLRSIEEWRSQAPLPALGDLAGHVKMAADMGLGNAAADKIDLRTLNP